MMERGLRTEAELVQRLRGDLDGTDRSKRALARRLGVAQCKLTAILRGRALSDRVAAALGYRRVVRFERMS